MKIFKRFLLVLTILLSGIYWFIASPILVGEKYEQTIDVSADSLEQHVAFLCNTPKYRNYLNYESLNIAADYIHLKFKEFSTRTEEQVYQVEDLDYRNIICSFGPEDGERIIVGAHYDVCEDQMGADDNASGVAGLIELARLLSVENNLKYRIDLVAYTLEEPPFFRTDKMGSAVHAKYCHDNNIDIKAMVVLEMIGYFTDEKNSQDYPLKALKLVYPNKGNFIAVVGKLGKGKLTRHMKKEMKKGSDIPVSSISAPASMPGIDFSDHLNYWNYDYDAVMITNTAFYRNKYYHETGDTADRLDYAKMAEVVKGVYYGIVGM